MSESTVSALPEQLRKDHGNDRASESGPRGVTDEQVSTDTAVDIDVDLEDEELLEKARNASNGEKFERLWRGSTAGYESQSEADMALCCLLAFWTGGDHARVDRLFR